MSNNHSLKSLVSNLAQYRKRQSLTQADLAALLNLPQSYIAKIESGTTDLRTSKLVEMARVLGLEVMLVPKANLYQVNQILVGEEHSIVRQTPAYMYEPDESDELDESEDESDEFEDE
ncbi:MAG: helix-turn-helix transcriptional regulator [Cyanobacteria bacterium TGS_CYA1]|nr:helix-turn-helix transcriptional regulator [Cyanobacteria bacterium TGS_CYA1]